MRLQRRRLAERRPRKSTSRSVPANRESTFTDPRDVAARTAEVVAARPGWVWPWWLERQVDTAGRAWMPAGPLGLLPNATGRSWTRIGAIDGTATALVDPRGLVCPANATWSLDWWIGADDRWHLPSREVGVRQHLVERAPVVETVMRVPGGDVKHRAFVVRVPSAEGGVHAVVVEIENDSALPFAVGVALRPATVDGIGHVGEVAVDGAAISVDGRPLVHLDRPIARAAVGDRVIDSAATAMNGGAIPPPVASSCQEGLAQAVAIVPLAHRATIRLALPVDVHDAPLQAFPSVLPQAGNVASGWTAMADQGVRLVPPPGHLADAILIAHRQLLVFGAVEAAGGKPHTEPLERFLIATTLDEFGHHDLADRVIARWLASLVRGGVIVKGVRSAAVAAALIALDRHRALADDDALLEASTDVVAVGASFLAHAASHEGGDRADLVWAAAGLTAATRLLRAAGHDQQAASDAADTTKVVTARRDAALERSGARANDPSGGVMPFDAESIDGAGRLLALTAAGLLDPRHAAVEGALASVGTTINPQEGEGQDNVENPTRTGAASLVSAGPDLGLDAAATLDVATVGLLRRSGGDPTGTVSSDSGICTERGISACLGAALDTASPTGAWPTLVHPQLKTGCVGDGHDAAITARFLRLARRLFVNTSPMSGDHLALCPVLPREWYRQGIEAHDLPTPRGHLSFAVRWHGSRPAILWEMRRHETEPERAERLQLRAPALEPDWSATEPRGEALLTPPAL